jgi:hypothetical protein
MHPSIRNFLYVLPNPFPVNRVKIFGEVNKDHKKGLMLFLVLLLYLSGSEGHVGSASASAEAALILW